MCPLTTMGSALQRSLFLYGQIHAIIFVAMVLKSKMFPLGTMHCTSLNHKSVSLHFPLHTMLNYLYDLLLKIAMVTCLTLFVQTYILLRHLILLGILSVFVISQAIIVKSKAK